MNEQRTVHPDEERLLAWIDEPATAPEGAALQAHLADCAECRRRAEGLEAFLAALGSASPAPGAAAFAAQRDRILAALPDRAVDRGVVAALLGWREWWVPSLAAAGLAALLVAGPGFRERVPNRGTPEAALPVQAAAQAAADEVFELVGAVEAVSTEDISPLAGEAVAEPLAATAMETVEETPVFAELGVEFAELSEDEQAAILEDLSNTTFDL